jgi:hypothetical protein
MSNKNKVKAAYIVQAVAGCQECGTIVIYCKKKNEPGMPTEIPIQKTDQEEFAEHVGQSMKTVLKQIPGIRMFPSQDGCNCAKITFNLTQEEFEGLGRPTYGDVIEMNLGREE